MKLQDRTHFQVKALTVQIKAGLRIKLIQTEIDNTGFINVDHLLTENFIIGIAKAQIEIEVEDSSTVYRFYSWLSRFG